VAILKNKSHFIFYLVSKKFYYNKPLYSDVEKCLHNLVEEMVKLNLTDLAMVKIGCGLDRLNWSIVSFIINETFSNTNIKVKIFDYEKNTQKLKQLKE
jgi:hypothetical protein